MIVYYCDHYELDLPPTHTFPMSKYRLLRETLLAEGVLRADELVGSSLVAVDDLRRVHTDEYVTAVFEGTLSRDTRRRIGFPWSPALVARTRASVYGTLHAARTALVEGVSGNLAGGTHHAFADRGAGYCVFNDLAVTAKTLLAEGEVRSVLIFDVDVHQGDGTAAIFADEQRVFTCSVHGERNFPFRKQQSDLDLPLADGAGDAEFLDAVQRGLESALWAGRPDLVLVQAGVDALESDHLGRMKVTPAGMRERDSIVFDRLWRAGIPFALTLGGGYSKPIEASIAAHVNTYRELCRVAAPVSDRSAESVAEPMSGGER